MYKKIFIIYTVFFFVGNYSLFAKTNKARSVKSSKAKSASSTSEKTTTANSKKTTTSKKTESTSSNEEGTQVEYTCQEKFNNCMDKVCINDLGIRYNCSTSVDSFDTVEKDGNKIRLGNDLYTYAKGTCISVLNSCELKDRNRIETEYKAQIQTDVLTKNYLDIMAYTGEEAAAEALQEYKDCMQPLCGDAFTDCFSINAVERRSPKCENVLSKTGRPQAVKRAFYEELENLNKEYCSNSGGYIDYDKKKCKIEVVIGKPKTTWKDGVEYIDPDGTLDKEFTRKYFNIGEIVECTQEYFSTFYEENPNRLKGIIKMASGITKAVAGVVTTVVGAIATAFSGGAAKGLIGSGVKMATHGSADAIDGYITLDSGNKKGACYINKKYVAGLGQYFKINFMQ
ncbi:hypothetical protein HDR59_03845 [bacterium]|nr:hypothetical protein [bacterium]